LYGVPASEPEIELFVPCETCDGTGIVEPRGAVTEPLFCRACAGEGEQVERITLRRLAALLDTPGRIDPGGAGGEDGAHGPRNLARR
jgi:DnaJ-class molecular chaperone